MMRYGQDEAEELPPEDESEGEDAPEEVAGPSPPPGAAPSGPSGGGPMPMPIPIPIPVTGPYAPAQDAYYPPGAIPKVPRRAVVHPYKAGPVPSPHHVAPPPHHIAPPPRHAVVHPHIAAPPPHHVAPPPRHAVVHPHLAKFRGEDSSPTQQVYNVGIGALAGWMLSKSLWGILIGAVVMRAVNYRRPLP